MKIAGSKISFVSTVYITALLFFVIISGCKCNWGNTPPAPDWRTYLDSAPYSKPPADPYKQMIVWLKPGTTGDQFSQWLKDNIVKNGNSADLKIRFVCGSCDSSLFLLEGSAVEVYMQGDVAKGGSSSKSKSKVTGESGPLYFSTNLPVHFPEDRPASQVGNTFKNNLQFTDSVVKVAVFDTGLDTALTGSSSLYTAIDSACIPGGSAGWNFTKGDSNWMDDNAQRHGTTVSKFIINEVERYQKNRVQVLPVKVFGSDGTGDLFSILCGFAYAHNRKVDIINASFGFYESIHKYDTTGKQLPDNTSPVLLKNFIDYYLTKNNILLIAAAGNKDDAIEDPEFDPADSLQKRNLDSVHFYPASLSSQLPNIIAVTTTYKDQVSPAQNFSNKVVDLGVNADFIDQTGRYVFINPINTTLEPVSGSSFAAPVITGKFTAWYHLYKSQLRQPFTTTTRDSIFSVLKNKPDPLFMYNLQGLANKIAAGKVVDKVNNTPTGFQGKSPRK
jgi:hypothetical protein